MTKTFKDHTYFIIFYGFIFLAFLWPLLLLKKTFIYGDYWQQFYPWTYHYAQCLRSGRMPYWTDLMACGFPLAAEGQIGPYYLLHLISYTLLPFPLAYTWSIPFHIFVGGAGFYLYGQKIGLSKTSAVLSAVLFSFSSAYGGCFYTTGTLRVLTWLPWSCLSLAMLAESTGKKRFFLVSLLAVLISQMWTAGFPQAALYALLYLFCLILFQGYGWRVFSGLFMACLLGFFLAFPQLVSTLELAAVSVRAGESAAFALWGSVLPPAVVSLMYPEWGIFLRVSFYMGILPIFFVFAGFYFKRSRTEWAHLALAALFCSLAFGKYNFLYSFIVEIFSFTSLRNPAKFLFFSSMSLAALAGFGFEKILSLKDDPALRSKLKKMTVALGLFIAALPFFASAIFRLGRRRWIDLAHRMAATIYSQKTDPMHPAVYYHEQAELMLNGVKHLFSYRNFFNGVTCVFCALSVIFLLAVLSITSRRKEWFKIAALLLVSADLLIFGYTQGTGFIGNARKIPESPDALMVDLRRIQSEDPGAMAEYAGDGNEILPPNSNMLYSVRHAGGYSPLLVKRYYELTKELGIVDSSLGRPAYSEKVWGEERGVVDVLGISTVLSDQKMTLPEIQLKGIVGWQNIRDGLRVPDKRFIYANARALPPVWAVYDWKMISSKPERLAYLKKREFDPSALAVVEESPLDLQPRPDLPATEARIISKDALAVRAQIDLLSDAMVVFRNVFYPHWKVRVDGVLKELLPVDHALSGVWVRKGPHEIKFFYDLRFYRFLEYLTAGVWILLAVFNWYLWKFKA